MIPFERKNILKEVNYKPNKKVRIYIFIDFIFIEIFPAYFENIIKDA